MERETAMKILKELHGKSLFAERTALETLIPELKESEDERIKRNIIAALKGVGYYDCDLTDECIAWLEKHGEQKPTEWHREDEQNLNACLGYIPDEFLRRWLTDAIHAKYDKSTDKGESNLLTVERAKEISPFMRSGFENESAAWSEEDEKEVAVLEAYIRSKDWSDRHIDRALGIIDELVKKLKSFKPQNRWKPSDEQMKFLWKYAEQNNYDGAILASLYSDLKQLKQL